MMTGPDANLYNALLRENIFPGEELDKMAENARRKNFSLHAFILAQDIMEEDKLLDLRSRCEGISLFDFRVTQPEDPAIAAVPAKFTWHYNLVPVKIEGDLLTIAVSEPLSVHAQDELRLMLGYQIKTVLAKRNQISEFLKTRYGLGADTVDKMVCADISDKGEDVSKKSKTPEIDDVEKLAGDASVIRLVNQIIYEAYRKRATDIHIEPFRGKLRLRYRIDGVLQDQKVPDEVDRFLPSILSRIKIMSNLNIVERRIPQDGKAIVKVQEEILDLRVSFIPTAHGESVVIRVLPSKTFLGLGGGLGFSDKDLELRSNLMKRSSGIIFATGPTGSGKSTTLYACLKEVDTTQKKVITIEDPIEYEMADITQIQVNESSGLTFAKGLRSMLRHDPDVIMVGEVRDKETAEIAIRASLTGHLILSSLHTNDAATGVARLVDIGIEPYMVASSVEAFIAQRLVRVICPNCKTRESEVDPEVIECIARGIGLESGQEIRIFRGKGCENCNYSGFYGRTAIYEILLVDRNIKRLIMEKATATEIKRKAVENGMVTLTQDGWHKVLNGITTPEEVLKVCQDLDPTSPPPEEERAYPFAKEDPKAEEKKEFVEPDKSETEVPQVTEPAVKQDPEDQRVHKRTRARLEIKYRLVEKGEGDIVFMEDRLSRQEMKEKIFTGELISRKMSQKEFIEQEAYREISSTTTNVSAGGAVFSSDFLLPEGSIIEFLMSVPGVSREIKCLSKVVRADREDKKGFNIVVCHLDMSGEDRRLVDEFVKNEIDRKVIRDIGKRG